MRKENATNDAGRETVVKDHQVEKNEMWEAFAESGRSMWDGCGCSRAEYEEAWVYFYNRRDFAADEEKRTFYDAAKEHAEREIGRACMDEAILSGRISRPGIALW